MKIHREVVLPVSLATAHQHLATALATPIVVQRGNLIVAKIVCSGRINGNELWVQYREYGRSISYIDMTGHLEEISGGVRLEMTVSSDEAASFLVYLPLLVAILFLVSSSIERGFRAESLVNYLLLLIFGAATFLVRWLSSSFFQVRIVKLEGILVQIIMG